MPASSSQPAAGGGSGGGKGQKFRARKAREAASKASDLAADAPPVVNGNGALERQAESSSVTTATSELDQLKVPDVAPSKE